MGQSVCCGAPLVQAPGDFMRDQYQCLACGRVYTGQRIAMGPPPIETAERS